MVIFVVSLMLSLGLGLTLRQIVAPLRNPVRVVLALVANFVLVPILAVAIARVFRLEQPFKTALIILGAAAGAPFLPKLTQLAKGDIPYGIGLMVIPPREPART